MVDGELHLIHCIFVTYTTIVSFVCSIAPMYVSGRTCIYDRGVGGSRSGGRDVAVERKERKKKDKQRADETKKWIHTKTCSSWVSLVYCVPLFGDGGTMPDVFKTSPSAFRATAAMLYAGCEEM